MTIRYVEMTPTERAVLARPSALTLRDDPFCRRGDGC